MLESREAGSILFHQIISFPAGVPFPPLPEQIGGADKQAARRRRVLVVDDERLIADTVTDILNEHGFNAVGVYSGMEAMEAARRFDPEIILSDVLMPRMSGIELAIRIREEFPETPVVLFSGQAATAELINEARAEGYEFELLPKPIHPRELIARLKEL